MPQDQGPPTGTVTCLFTDIEGSTRIELALGTGPYRDVRERHRELLRTASVAHDGFEQSTEGDSFFLIFLRPGLNLLQQCSCFRAHTVNIA